MNDTQSTGECKGMVCPITGCPIKKVLMATIVTFLVTMAYDWVFHGIYMMPDYQATASMWRTEAEMQSLFNICILYHAVLAFGVAGLYCFVGKNASCGGACLKTGLRFGLLLGLIIGISHFASYIWMPIPMAMAVKWLAGSVVWGLIVGFVLSLLSKKCCCSKTTA